MHDSGEDFLDLGTYAQRAYLEYAMSVVKGRALPDVADGQKPVQRRILYAMKDMGLVTGAKPVKSARVVGEILGKYHPHGDSSAYEAMVRMAQDFTLRYPLIDGVGNFGSRDGDGAAAMRYTEARLTPVAELLLSELDMGTVDFLPNYDGAFNEPSVLPARLPMVLLNGASGIAVGMATEIPPHNLREVAAAAIACLHTPGLQTADLAAYLPGPDFPGGGQIISTDEELRAVYEHGRGSVRVRARYEIEPLARGRWRAVVYELPPGVSAQKILAAVEEQSNPRPKAGKKQLSQEQQNTRSLMLSLLEKVRDESDNESPVRLVFEPKSGRQDPQEFMNILMAQTALEGNVSVNLVMMGRDNRPAQKTLADILYEWLDFRMQTVTRRTQFRLDGVKRRIHILEGRQIVFLHLDEVIRVIRESDEPKPELMQTFSLSALQAEDILEIRLRQLARLEWIRLESELQEKRQERDNLLKLLGSEAEMKKLVGREIKADAERYGDTRRTLIQAAGRAVSVQTTADEPVTVILSRHGWLRKRTGHHIDLTQVGFKEGDSLLQAVEGRTVQPLVIPDTAGRMYTVDIADIPGGRGDGIPVSSLVETSDGAHASALMTAQTAPYYLLACSGGYGFVVPFEELVSRNRSGKSVMTVKPGEVMLPPVPVFAADPEKADEVFVILATAENRLSAFPLSQMQVKAKGRGLQLVPVAEGDSLKQLILTREAVYAVHSKGKRGGVYKDTLRVADIAGKRGRKGKILDIPGTEIRLGNG